MSTTIFIIKTRTTVPVKLQAVTATEKALREVILEHQNQSFQLRGGELMTVYSPASKDLIPRRNNHCSIKPS